MRVGLDMHRDDVGFLEQGLERRALGAGFGGALRRERARIREHASFTECFHDPRDFLADSAEAENPDGFSRQRVAGDRRPEFFAHAQVHLRNLA